MVITAGAGMTLKFILLVARKALLDCDVFAGILSLKDPRLILLDSWNSMSLNCLSLMLALVRCKIGQAYTLPASRAFAVSRAVRT